jgi:hypothetical protein
MAILVLDTRILGHVLNTETHLVTRKEDTLKMEGSMKIRAFPDNPSGYFMTLQRWKVQ